MALTKTPAPPDALEVDAGVIDEARRHQHRRRGRVSALVFAVLVAALVAHEAGGGGTTKPPTTASKPAPIAPVGHAVSFRSARGHSAVSFTMHERSGIILLAQISVPRGVRAIVNATNPYGGTATITTAADRHNTSLSCHTRGSANVCTQAYEACPLIEATWQFHVVKLSGPAGPVRVDFIVGAPPSQS